MGKKVKKLITREESLEILCAHPSFPYGRQWFFRILSAVKDKYFPDYPSIRWSEVRKWATVGGSSNQKKMVRVIDDIVQGRVYKPQDEDPLTEETLRGLYSTRIDTWLGRGLASRFYPDTNERYFLRSDVRRFLETSGVVDESMRSGYLKKLQGV